VSRFNHLLLIPIDLSAIFVYILIVHTSSALISQQAITEKHVNLLSNLEKALAFYFFIEFLLRIWSAGADKRFQGWKGKFQNLVIFNDF
jgi:hypothetical protein